jgi:hypothetical protein
MMLAHREHFNVLHNHHVVGVLVEDSVLDNFMNVLLVAFGEVEDGLGGSGWRLDKTLATRILAYRVQNVQVGLRDLVCSALDGALLEITLLHSFDRRVLFFGYKFRRLVFLSAFFFLVRIRKNRVRFEKANLYLPFNSMIGKLFEPFVSPFEFMFEKI